MKSILFMCIIVLTTISCSKKLTGHFDPAQAFEVVDYPIGPYEVQVNDARHAKILSWIELNNENWKRTYNKTWAGKVQVYQENFKLLLYRNSEFAVVIITDDKNISRYYRRVFDNDGLKFLDE